MHIFLTGEIQIGKSTIIRQVLDRLNVKAGGFLTEFDGNRSAWPKRLYMRAIPTNPLNENSCLAVLMRENERPRIYLDTFEVFGVHLLREAMEHAPLIVMDECGRLEGEAALFQETVLKALESPKPILGVVRQLPYASWLDNIKAHPSVTLVTVTRENRDGLGEKLAKLFEIGYTSDALSS